MADCDQNAKRRDGKQHEACRDATVRTARYVCSKPGNAWIEEVANNDLRLTHDVPRQMQPLNKQCSRSETVSLLHEFASDARPSCEELANTASWPTHQQCVSLRELSSMSLDQRRVTARLVAITVSVSIETRNAAAISSAEQYRKIQRLQNASHRRFRAKHSDKAITKLKSLQHVHAQ